MKIIDAEKLEKILDERINGDIKSKFICGAGISVCQNGKPVLEKCYGSSRVFENVPLKENSIFRAASMTKPLTGVSVLKEIERGNIDIFDSVEDFIPEMKDARLAKVENGKLVIGEKAKNKVRILHLLTHRSGVGSCEVGDKLNGTITAKDTESLEAFARFFASAPLAFEPGTFGAYSSQGASSILARIVEIVSGKKYFDYLNENFFTPLGMTDTGFEPDGEQLSRFVDMHMFDGTDTGVREMFEGCVFEKTPYSATCGGAGLFTTLKDYSRFACMLANGGCLDGKEYFTKSSMHSLTVPHIPEDQTENINWSYLMRIVDREEYKLLPTRCFGWSGAYGTHFFVDPNNGISAVYMKNSMYDGGSEAVTGKHFEADVMSAAI